MTPAQLLERLGFEAAQLSAPVSDLSGGQKRRLQLMLILLDKPNVLILDEPDNDLDIDMLAVVESLLDTWPGTLLLITHDRYLMERVTDDQFALVDGKIRHVPGGVDEYLRLLDERDSARAAAGAAEAREVAASSAGPDTEARPARPHARGGVPPEEGARVNRAQARNGLGEGRGSPARPRRRRHLRLRRDPRSAGAGGRNRAAARRARRRMAEDH